MLVCASEDADWLANGVEAGLGIGELKKSIYWNSREIVHVNEDGSKVEISPIEKAYEEVIDIFSYGVTRFDTPAKKRFHAEWNRS